MDPTKVLERFNKKAKEWMSDLKEIKESDFSVNPIENFWSYAEVYDHVMRVARNYQIPNLKKSVTPLAKRIKKKNWIGIAIFNLGVRKQTKMIMQNFPAPLVEDFTPVKRSKADILEDFGRFIEEVNSLADIVSKSSKNNKHYHPLFGDINTKEWFALIELHIDQHDKQKEKIKASFKSLG